MDPNELIQFEQQPDPVPMSRLKPSEQSDRFTFRLEAYWEHFGEDPVGNLVVGSKLLDTLGVEPYVRKFKATETPRELSLGDISREEVGYILVTNVEGMKLQWNPTAEEREDIKQRVAVIDGFELHPYGLPFFGQPTKDSPLMVKCLHGQAVLQVYIYPR
jgi:hypothetical protein